jgi:hypothetical protein
MTPTTGQQDTARRRRGAGPDLDGVVADALEELEAFHGELPIEPIPGLDVDP